MSLRVKTKASIRPAESSDIDQLTQLEQHSFQYDVLSRQSFSRFLTRTTAKIFIAEVENHLAGYIIVLTRKNSQRARIYSLAVSEQYRGHHIGQRLIEEAIKYSDHLNKKSVYLEVQLSNQPAIKLYEKLGFQYKSTKREYYDDLQDALCYELNKA